MLTLGAGRYRAGAALGPLFAGLISPSGWNNVFYMLISADLLACLVSDGTEPRRAAPRRVPTA